MQIDKALNSYLDAGFPIIYINSFEDDVTNEFVIKNYVGYTSYQTEEYNGTYTYWLRSRYQVGNKYDTVGSDGRTSAEYSTTELGVVIGFCI